MIRDEDLPVAVVPMETRDIPAIMEIERASFTTPWSASAYRHELERNELAHYFVLLPREALEGAIEHRAPSLRDRISRWLLGINPSGRPVMGYAGYWLMAGEAHISTIALDPTWRSKGLGEYLLLRTIEAAIADGADLVTLEVRVSNTRAQNLYEKYGFDVVGRRKRYYHDNNEDALIMTVEGVQSATYCDFLAMRREARLHRLTETDVHAAE
ncbi:MAG TPA: ribosomal-protein-alanine N-acetyltransferase [Chloroflexi bacterium]|nr:ribosomal-protein-alanine N-acetyltransferase [Chloroflexota bacterium]